jgi:hypothetical protein
VSRVIHRDNPSDPIECAIEGERIGVVALDRIAAGCSDPDLLMRAVMRAMAVDGHVVPLGQALRATCRQVQKRLEAGNGLA